jgi:hypothetical protein
MKCQQKFRNLWLWKCGRPEEFSIYDVPLIKQSKPDLPKLKKEAWSKTFERLMRNRLVLGSIRYGGVHDRCCSKQNRVASIEKRIAAYKETGNTEHLVDIANLCMVEFVIGKHPQKHFATIDSGDSKLKLK